MQQHKIILWQGVPQHEELCEGVATVGMLKNSELECLLGLLAEGTNSAFATETQKNDENNKNILTIM